MPSTPSPAASLEAMLELQAALKRLGQASKRLTKLRTTRFPDHVDNHAQQAKDAFAQAMAHLRNGNK